MGTYEATSSSDSQVVVDTYSAGQWVVSFPGGAPGAEDALLGVSCASAGSCVAVGWSYAAASGGLPAAQQPLVATLHAGAWQFNVLAGDGYATSTLDVVDCPSRSWCLAAGVRASPYQTFLATLAGGQWTLSAPLPYGAAATALSCPAAGTCALGINGTALAMLSGGTWQTTTGWQVGISGGLGGVSCATSAACTAVGYNVATANAVSVLTKGTWAKRRIPAPKGTGIDVGLSGASCIRGRPATCLAAGWYSANGGPTQAVWEIESAGKWKLATSVNPPGLGYASVESVSCASLTLCAMTGLGTDADKDRVTWVEAGDDWTAGPARVTGRTSVFPA